MTKDLHQHIENLKKNNLLYTVDRPINIDTELAPLVRLEFLAQKENDRKAFLFTNVHNSLGQKFEMPVIVASVAASQKMMGVGLGCEVTELNDKMVQGIEAPIAPVEVKQAKCQEIVYQVDEKDPHGFDLFPIPVSTPGWDVGPFLTCAQWVSKDPISGEVNVGNYRGHLKSPTRTGIKLMGPQQDIFKHLRSAFELKQPLDVAIVIGGPPALTYASVTKAPYGVDEIAVAGGILGEPVEVVKCKNSDLMVPANAEIVFECKINIDFLEHEGPFGEYHGYMNPVSFDIFADLQCVTYRKDAIWQTLQAQCPPTESSIMLGVGNNALLNKLLKKDLGIIGVNDAYTYVPEYGAKMFTVIQMKNPGTDDTIRALMGAGAFVSFGSRICIAVDDDIDPRNLSRVMWAVGARCNPAKDVNVIKGFKKGALPPYGAFSEDGLCPDRGLDEDQSIILMDATTRGRRFSPVSLPKKEYMESALQIWNELGLPEIDLQMPWYGYKVSENGWPDALVDRAENATQGKYYSQEMDDLYKATRIPLDRYYTYTKEK